MSGPSLDDVTNAECPEDKPYKCLPYGSCYGYDSYCGQRSRAVESCFPNHLTTMESKQDYCQDISQNVSKLLDKSCRFACETIPKAPEKSPVYESCPDILIWQIPAIISCVILGFILVRWLICYCRSNKNWRKIYHKVTYTRPDTRADDDGDEAEKVDLGVQQRVSDDQVVNLNVDDVDTGGVTSRDNQIQSPALQNLLESTNDMPRLQQPSLNNRDSGEIPPRYSSGNASSISSPVSSSASSVGTNNDSGISPGSEGVDHMNLVQLSLQTQVLTNEICSSSQQFYREQGTNGRFVTNSSIPDTESRVVTSASVYKRD